MSAKRGTGIARSPLGFLIYTQMWVVAVISVEVPTIWAHFGNGAMDKRNFAVGIPAPRDGTHLFL